MGIQCVAAILCWPERKLCDWFVQHEICPAKSTTLLPTRGAGLVQIAKSFIERFSSALKSIFLGCGRITVRFIESG